MKDNSKLMLNYVNRTFYLNEKYGRINMENTKKILMIASLLILAMSFTACKGMESSKVIPKESAKEIPKEAAKETPSNNKEVKNSDSVEKEEFAYSVIDETYTEKGITIKFPQLTKASNEAKSDLINKAIQVSIRMKLDSLRMDNEDMGAFSLDLKYEITKYDNKVLSIVYNGISHFEKTAYPVNIFHAQNIIVDEVDTVPLKAIFTIDDNFIEAFKSGNYSPYTDDLNLENSGVNLKETIESQYTNKDLVELFQNDKANYKLTMYGVIISIEVPHAIGDHLEMAIPFEAVESNMIKSSPVWKDYLFIK